MPCSAAWPRGLWHPRDSRERLWGVTAQPVPCEQGSPPSHQTRHRGGRLASKSWGSSLEWQCEGTGRAPGGVSRPSESWGCAVLSITHFRNSVVLFVCQSYRSGFVRFWSVDLQSTLTSAGVGEAETACARLAALPELPCAHSWGCQCRRSSRKSHFIWWE